MDIISGTTYHYGFSMGLMGMGGAGDEEVGWWFF